MSDSAHLMSKQVNILVTNICNLSCGGCSQQCGYIPKEKLWNIPLSQLEWNIDLLIDCRKGNPGRIGLFGGEPTLHPEFDDMIDLLLSYEHQGFQVYTNGRELGSERTKDRKNVSFRVDFKDRNTRRCFVPTQVAPKDVMEVPDNRFYWEKAKKDCHMWKNCCCIIYNNRAYFCEAPAAWDIMNEENHGWPLRWGEDPFSKTDAQIAQQADNFCYRCGWCLLSKDLKQAGLPTQTIQDATIATKLNSGMVTRKPMNQHAPRPRRRIKFL